MEGAVLKPVGGRLLHITLGVPLSLIAPAVASAQGAGAAAPATEAARPCAELTQLDLQNAAGGPGRVTSARLRPCS